jgi:glutamyl-tRNA reductase
MKKVEQAESHLRKAIAYSHNTATALNSLAQLKLSQGKKKRRYTTVKNQSISIQTLPTPMPC